MAFLRIYFALAAAAALSISAAGQASGPSAPPQPKMKVIAPKAQAAPFPWNSLNAQSPSSVEIRTPDQMMAQDRNLELDAEASIAEHATLAGLEFNQGSWSFRQVVCPALPKHLFLRFARDQGPGDVSEFTASVPRNGKGRVRIVPIERRGYSLFSPAAVSALTISVFNRVRAEEPSGETPGWLGISLCYAALTGASPRIGEPDSASGRSAPPPALRILKRGAVVRFTDVAAHTLPVRWTLTFDDKGNLLKVVRAPAPAPSRRRPSPASVGK